MQIGDMRVDPLIDGELVLPGPSLYTNTTDADWLEYDQFLEPVDFQPIHLTTVGGLLVRYGDRTVVMDCGVGPAPKPPFRGGGFRSSLAALGVRRAEVTNVIFSHLHFDHIGWASEDNKPFFPNAAYHVDRRDWDYYCGPDAQLPPIEADFCNAETDAPSVRLAPVADRMELFEGDQEIIPSIAALEASGHTPGETVLQLSSRGERGLYLGDLVHTQAELLDDDPTGKWCFLAHYDHDAANESVDRFRKLIVDEDLPFTAAHFGGLRWAKIRINSGKREWQELPV